MSHMTILILGFFIGMRHALESDHLAAVASLSTRSPGFRRTVQLGATWGVGHTLTLFLFGSVVLWMDKIIPDQLAHVLEWIVGVMLVGLGIDVLRRLRRDRIHFHLHHHADGTTHFHAHSHSQDTDDHEHRHREGFPLRALLVGMVHGMAGSAALIMLTLQTIRDPWLGMLYILIFGVGSIAGMAAVASIIALPLHFSARHMTRIHGGLQVFIGLFAIAWGAMLLWELTPEIFSVS